MADVREKIRDYKPSKKVWFWSCIGTALVTMTLGFTWGGWVTGGTANAMAEAGAEKARASLAATVCVNRFLAAPDARTALVSLQEESRFSQDDFVEDGGWVTFGDSEDPIEGAASLCAEQLAEAELPPAPVEAPLVEADANNVTPNEPLPSENAAAEPS